MPEFDSISGIMPIIAGGALTLAGVWFQGRQQRQTKLLDHENERKALLREKAEIIYQTMDSLSHHSVTAAIGAALGASKGLMPEATGNPELHSRLMSLLAIYFPESSPIVAAHQQRLEAQTAPLVAKMMDPKFSDAASVQKNKAILFATAGAETSKFISELKEFMDREVRKLV